MHRLLTLTIALLTLAAIFAPARTTEAHSFPLQSASLVLDWYPNSDHGGLFTAMQRGFLRQKGINMSAYVPSDTTAQIKLVAAGRADFGISYETDLLGARVHHIPVQSVMCIMQHPLNTVMTLRSSGITRPRELAGRTVGMAGSPSDIPTVKALMAHDHGSFSRVRMVNVGYSLLKSLLAEKVDAVVGVYWTWEALQAQQQGYRVNIMRLDHYGVPTYDELIFATGTGQLAREPATLRQFQRATFEGYAYAAAHPAEAARILLKAPQVLSRDARLLEQSIRLLAPEERDARGHYGAMSASQWQGYADWMLRTGLVKKPIDARAAVTEALLP